MKTIVFAYSEFGVVGIEALLEAGYDIAAVFTYPEDPRDMGYYRSVAKTCVAHAIPAYRLKDSGDPEWRERLEAIAPDYIFSFYYRELIPDSILSLARKGAYNIHGSLLPHYRGRAPVNWVLVRGETRTGVTLHHMVTRADAGDIVAQTPVEIAYHDTAFTLQHKLLDAARHLFKTQLPLIAQGKAARIRQDISQGNYCGRRGPEDGRIDWSQPAETVRNLVRAVTEPYPGAFTMLEGGRKLLIWDSEVAKHAGKAPPGSVLDASPLVIACGKDALVVKAAQLEGGLYLSGAQAASELGLMPGAQFGASLKAAS